MKVKQTKDGRWIGVDPYSGKILYGPFAEAGDVYKAADPRAAAPKPQPEQEPAGTDAAAKTDQAPNSGPDKDKTDAQQETDKPGGGDATSNKAPAKKKTAKK